MKPFTPGNMFSSGTTWDTTEIQRVTGLEWRGGEIPTTESMKIIPVTEDLRENLPSILGAESPSIPFSRMNPLSPSSVWAQMMKTSAMGELVIQFLLPFTIQTLASLSYLIITER